MLDLSAKPFSKVSLPKRVEMLPVESSNIHSVGWDYKRKRMYIKFLNGYVYQYENVESDEFREIRQASSKGKWFWANMRQRPDKYPYKRLSKDADTFEIILPRRYYSKILDRNKSWSLDDNKMND